MGRRYGCRATLRDDKNRRGKITIRTTGLTGKQGKEGKKKEDNPDTAYQRIFSNIFPSATVTSKNFAIFGNQRQ